MPKIDAIPYPDELLTHAVIGGAIEVHRQLGPGLLESAYRRCLAHELEMRGLPIKSEVPVDLTYKGLVLPACYRLDMVVGQRLVVEIKASDPNEIHKAQLLTYLRLTNVRIGLLINFKKTLLKDGITRMVR